MKQKEHAEGEEIIFSLVYKSGEMKFLNFWSLASISEHFFFKHSLGRRRRRPRRCHRRSGPKPPRLSFISVSKRIFNVNSNGEHPRCFSGCCGCERYAKLCAPFVTPGRTFKTSLRRSSAIKEHVLVLGCERMLKRSEIPDKSFKASEWFLFRSFWLWIWLVSMNTWMNRSRSVAREK